MRRRLAPPAGGGGAMLRAAVLLLSRAASGLDDGLALRPPMGWRSWNCFAGDVTQVQMESIMDAMASRARTVNGRHTSLVDLGYTRCGLDDGWQNMTGCHEGSGGRNSFHDENGRPLVNLTAFPDMKSMTAHGHNRGLKVGWYMNNCICSENKFGSFPFQEPAWYDLIYSASAQAVADYGFDALKLDGCSQFMDLNRWSAKLNATRRHILIENCHWGCTTPDFPDVKPVVTPGNAECHVRARLPWPFPADYPIQGDGMCKGTEGVSDCPYHMYRTSVDVKATWESVYKNLQTVVPFLGNPPVSRPGAWAYPDMLEVGRLASFEEDRSHFGAWAIISSPLILGYDLRDSHVMDQVWDIISNTEVIEVNQAWAGHPGMLISDAVGHRNSLRQLWAKPLSRSRVAAFVLSNGCKPAQVTINLADIGITDGGEVSVRDIYSHSDLARVSVSFQTDAFGNHDSRFYIFETSGTITFPPAVDIYSQGDNVEVII